MARRSPVFRGWVVHMGWTCVCAMCFQKLGWIQRRIHNIDIPGVCFQTLSFKYGLVGTWLGNPPFGGCYLDGKQKDTNHFGWSQHRGPTSETPPPKAKGQSTCLLVTPKHLPLKSCIACHVSEATETDVQLLTWLSHFLRGLAKQSLNLLCTNNLVDVGREATTLNFLPLKWGLQPLNHNKQKRENA